MPDIYARKQCVYKIERVQKRLLKLLCIRSNVHYSSTAYEDLFYLFQLSSLESRREIADLLLFHKIIETVVRDMRIAQREQHPLFPILYVQR